MTDLYRLSVGPLGNAYYQQQFTRFETLGKAIPSWNSAAAFFTLAWMVLRRMWRAAAVYAGVWLLLLALWYLVLHQQLPLQLEVAACLFGLLLMCVVPGFLANSWYYAQVRNRTLATLTQASSIAQARAQLAARSPSKEHLHIVAAVQALCILGIAAWIAWFYSTTTTSPETPPSPPALVIPSTISPPPAADIPVVEELAQAENLAVQDSAAAPVRSAPPAPEPPETVPVDTPAPTPAFTEVAVEPTKPAPVPQALPAAPVAPIAPTTPAVATAPVPSKAAPAAKKPASTAANKLQHLIPGKYYLNAGVYAQAANVERTVKQLQAAKLPTLRHTVASPQGTLTRLRIGPFDTRKQAEQAAAKAKTLRLETSVFQHPRQ